MEQIDMEFGNAAQVSEEGDIIAHERRDGETVYYVVNDKTKEKINEEDQLSLEELKQSSEYKKRTVACIMSMTQDMKMNTVKKQVMI